MLVFSMLSVLMGLAFISFAVVQFNDPDPAQWIVIYGLMALASFLGAARRLGHRTAFALAATMAVLTWVYSDTSRAFDLDDEIVREELGLALATVWALVLAFVMQRVSARRTIDAPS